MTNFRSKSIITAGFITILVLLLAVMALWIHDVTTYREKLQFIVDVEQEREYVSDMRDSVYRRAIALHRMLMLEDPFDRDDEFITYREKGDTFLISRAKLLATEMSDAEKEIWEKTRVILNKGSNAQNQVIVLLSDEQTENAADILLNEVVPTQDNFIMEISRLFELKGETIDQNLGQVTEDSDRSLFLILLLGSVAVLLAGFTIFVVRRTGKTEDALMEQGDRIRSLYEVSAKIGATSDEQVHEMLQLGCRFLATDIGKVCKIDTENNTNKVLKVCSTLNNLSIKDGAVLPLDLTFCKIAFADDKPIAINNVAESIYRNNKCYEFSHLESYVATQIWVGGEKYGTLNFSSLKPRQIPFSKTDIDLVNLIGSWISVTLEQQIAKEELHVAKEDAEKANLTKSAFLAKMSHELRTPLNAIIGYSELLKDEVEDNKQQEYLPDLEKISSSGAHLLTLINDILDLSKIEAGKMELFLEEFSVQSLTEDVQQTVVPLMKSNNNKFFVNLPRVSGDVRGDKLKLKQVLLNLLSNASKFTDNGVITLDVRRIENAGKEFISFSVIDTGIGIEEGQRDSIFVDFSQADSSTASKYGGTGLGLTISRQICRMMGGDIAVVSQLGRGSTFTVTLPAAVSNIEGNNQPISISNTG